MKARFESCSVPREGTLRDALLALENGQAQIALVVDGNRRLVGVLTDGDVRRAFLGGAGAETPLAPFVKSQFVSVPPGTSRGEVLDLMRGRTIEQIPIVDDGGHLRGVHLLHEILGAIVRPNWAVVMAGGRGTRLHPLTATIPKPMLKVAGRPIIERLVLHLVGFGIRKIFLSVNYLADVIEEYFGDGHKYGCGIEYLREDVPLGTAGALTLLPQAPVDPLVVLNGDLITTCDVASLLEAHGRGGFAATVGLQTYSHTVPFGVVDVDDDRIVSIREKPTHSWPTNAGVYVLSPGVVTRLPEQASLSMPDCLQDCLDRGERVGAFYIEGEHIDVGRTSELARARGEST